VDFRTAGLAGVVGTCQQLVVEWDCMAVDHTLAVAKLHLYSDLQEEMMDCTAAVDRTLVVVEVHLRSGLLVGVPSYIADIEHLQSGDLAGYIEIGSLAESRDYKEHRPAVVEQLVEADTGSQLGYKVAGLVVYIVIVVVIVVGHMDLRLKPRPLNLSSLVYRQGWRSKRKLHVQEEAQVGELSVHLEGIQVELGGPKQNLLYRCSHRTSSHMSEGLKIICLQKPTKHCTDCSNGPSNLVALEGPQVVVVLRGD
jgi:hypothetical protein